jgi:hypothetical protein
MELDLSSAEAQLNTLIERRATQREKANELADMWAKSERKHRERIQRANRAAWYTFFADMADAFRARADDYDRRAESLCEEPGREDA